MNVLIAQAIQDHSKATDAAASILMQLCQYVGYDGVGPYREEWVRPRIRPEAYDPALKWLQEAGELILGDVDIYETGKSKVAAYYIPLGQSEAQMADIFWDRFEMPKKDAAKRARDYFARYHPESRNG